MGIEIERKFLVVGNTWTRRILEVRRIRQGYLPTAEDVTVRIRLVHGPHSVDAFVTVKGPARGIRKPEFEYGIPPEDAAEMLGTLCSARIVEKHRHIVPAGHRFWEVDVFKGRHEGLVLAEIELRKPDAKVYLPKWVGREVSRDSRYSNHSLAIHGLELVG